ncbi:MAG: DUF5050 domain-containing protein [Calditrichaeota bacterium]|nr:MAG: DUF5050 domain-containing protein [Calditrichota bacterium]
MIGETISHYTITEFIGEGGIGVVYKAHDFHLNRVVAIKFLPQSFSKDAGIREQFLHGARAASALDHPNICPIHDFDQTVDGHMFMVMAFCEGRTLRQIIDETTKDSGPGLPHEQSIDIIFQLVQGLGEAHKNGVVHRDIKPSNIIVSNDGELKILDFGLAQIKGGVEKFENSAAPGTLLYMSPEQAIGEKTDSRSDIWSLGVVMYEMLGGVLPFQGEYEQAVIYAILKENPELITRRRSDVPPALETIIHKCLGKNPSLRYPTCASLIADLAPLRQKILVPTNGAYTSVEIAKPSHPSRFLWSIIASSIALIAFFMFYTFLPFDREAHPGPVAEMPFTSLDGMEYSPDFSPDSKEIAFYWKENDLINPDIYIKSIRTGEMRQVTKHPGGERYPVWSPDGKNIAYVRADKIYISSSLGNGTEKLLCSKAAFGGVDWSPDGKWIAFTEGDSSNNIFISIISVETGERRSLTSIPQKTQWEQDLWPVFSPDGQKIAFSRHLGFERADIYTVTFDGRQTKRLTFDEKEVIGLAWTPNGGEIIFSSNRGGERRLWRISAKGGKPELLSVGQYARYPTVSPDGKRLAYAELKISQSIWSVDFPGASGFEFAPKKIISSSRSDEIFKLSPDGKRIVFESNRSGNYEIWLCDSDGGNPLQLTHLKNSSGAPCWSPDGKWIAFTSKSNGDYDIFVVSRDGGELKRMTTEPSHDTFPHWSKDGSWIYFSSNKSGDHNIWKIPLPGGTSVQMTNKPSRHAFESADGKWLYYHRKDNGFIYKMPVGGGESSLVLNEDISGFYWALAEDGIYYFDLYSKKWHFKFFDFATQTTKIITTLEFEGECYNPQISPDRRRLYFNYEEPWQADIKLVENWR